MFVKVETYNMKYLILVLFVINSVLNVLGQDNLHENYSGFMLNPGNIQSELYYNGLPVFNSRGDLTSLVVRYGVSKTLEFNARISHKSISIMDDKISGIIPLSLGTKVFLYSNSEINLFSHFELLFPATTGDFNAEGLGYYFDFMAQRQFNDIFSLEATFGILQQLDASTPYLSFQGIMQVTDYLDLFNQLDMIFDESYDNSWYRIGAKLWVTEDVKLNLDYGLSLVSEFGDRISIGVLARWLD